MNLAEVIGSIWATQKEASFNGMKLCWIQPIDQRRNAVGSPIIAVDPDSQAGEGETVFYVEGGDAAQLKEGHEMPSDATIVGIVDSIGLQRDQP